MYRSGTIPEGPRQRGQPPSRQPLSRPRCAGYRGPSDSARTLAGASARLSGFLVATWMCWRGWRGWWVARKPHGVWALDSSVCQGENLRSLFSFRMRGNIDFETGEHGGSTSSTHVPSSPITLRHPSVGKAGSGNQKLNSDSVVVYYDLNQVKFSSGQLTRDTYSQSRLAAFMAKPSGETGFCAEKKDKALL